MAGHVPNVNYQAYLQFVQTFRFAPLAALELGTPPRHTCNSSRHWSQALGAVNQFYVAMKVELTSRAKHGYTQNSARHLHLLSASIYSVAG